MDYKTEMNNNKIIFPVLYEEILEKLSAFLITDPILKKKLKEKREFGLKKYGEYSFQSSFENAMSSPVVEHAEEECIDLVNYILHMMFVANVKNESQRVETLGALLKEINKIYFLLKKI